MNKVILDIANPPNKLESGDLFLKTESGEISILSILELVDGDRWVLVNLSTGKPTLYGESFDYLLWGFELLGKRIITVS